MSTSAAAALYPSLHGLRPAHAEAVLPGDTYAGVDVGLAARAWSSAGVPAQFVRVRLTAEGVGVVSVLEFDGDGFGSVRSWIFAGAAVPEVAGLGVGVRVVLISEEGVPVPAGLVAAERLTFAELRVCEEALLQIARRDADRGPGMGAALVAGSSSARSAMFAAARADLLGLVATAGRRVALH